MQGIVQSVQTYPGGDYPTGLTPSGATVISFGNAADFDPDGGLVDVDGVELAYVSVDLEADVMTLAEPLEFDVPEDIFVATVPATESAHAMVALGDDIVMAEVPHHLKALLDVGERGPGEGEAVIVQEITPGTHRVMDVSGQPPAIDGRFTYNLDEALLANRQMLGEKLAENDAAMIEAQGELSAAQQRINDAFGEIDLKVDEDYVDAAKQQAIDAAADDAASKASAAQSAAVQTAQAALDQAEIDLQAAISSGDAAAIADAEGKIATAKQEAITAAANDATAKAGEAMQKANAALTAAESAQATADNAIRTWYQEEPPWADGTVQSDDVLGDMWYQDSTGQAYRWNGTTWRVIQDASIGEALAAAATAQTTADGKITAFYQDNEPLEADEGDIWFDTGNNSKIHRRSGGDWLALLDPKALADAAESAAITAAAADATAKAEAAEAAAAQTAAADAQDKADAAQAAAEAAAQDYADSVAAGEGAGALAAAKDYAEQQAAAAQSAAETAAALDATAKAEAAESAAAATASADASSKADAAQAAAISAAAADATAKANAARQDAIDELNTRIASLNAGLTNMIPNPGFEDGMSGWDNVRGFTADTSEKHSGSASATCGPDSVSLDSPVEVPVRPGETWRWTSWVKTSPGFAGSLGMRPIRRGSYGGINVPGHVNVPSALVDGWQKLVMDYTVIEGDTALQAMRFANSITAGQVWIDDVSFSDVTELVALEQRVAALAQQAKDAADAAQQTADEAKQDAADALTDAKAYTVTMTDGLAKGVESTALPGSTVMPKDSVWRRVDGNGNYSAVFVQTAAPTGSNWQARAITSEVVDNLDAGKITASQAVVDQGVINKFAAQLANIIEANIGNLTVTGSAHLDSLVAETIAGDTASFMELTVDQILAGFLQAQWIITEQGSIVAGDPLGARVEITSDGVRVYVVGPNGMPYEAVAMVNDEISFGVIGQDGTRLGGIASDGSVSGTSGSFSKDVRIKGLPVVGQLGDPDALPGWLDNLPRGIIAYNGRVKVTAQVATGSEFRYMKTTATLYPNRRYRVVAGARVVPNSSNSAVYLSIRHTLGSGLPTTAGDPKLGPTEDGVATATQSGFQRVTPRYEGFISVGVEEVRSFVSTITGFYGATPNATSGFIYVEDVGPLVQESGSEDGGVGDVLYQATWIASASRMYDKSGGTMSGRDGDIDVWMWGGSPTDFQSSAWVYNDGAEKATHGTELGKTLGQALVGSTIRKVEVYIRNKVWYSGVSGVGAIALGTLASSSLPTTKQVDGSYWVDGIEEGEGIWIDVPVSLGWFTNGANRGLTLGDHDGVALNRSGEPEPPSSGSFHGIGDTDPPQLRITYSR